MGGWVGSVGGSIGWLGVGLVRLAENMANQPSIALAGLSLNLVSQICERRYRVSWNKVYLMHNIKKNTKSQKLYIYLCLLSMDM